MYVSERARSYNAHAVRYFAAPRCLWPVAAKVMTVS